MEDDPIHTMNVLLCAVPRAQFTGAFVWDTPDLRILERAELKLQTHDMTTYPANKKGDRMSRSSIL